MALCSLTNLANPDHIKLLGELKGHRFSVGCLTLGEYGVEHAPEDDPISVALKSGILNTMPGQDLPARDIVQIAETFKVALNDAECIYRGRRSTCLLACDSIITRNILIKEFTANRVVSTLDILAEAVELRQLTIADAVKARDAIARRTGLLPENKDDYFLPKC